MKKLSLATAVACLGFGVAAASASVPTVGSTATLELLGGPSDTFYGAVDSSKATCEQSRKVKVEKVVSGTDQVITQAVTDSGQWHSVIPPVSNGKYYAKVTTKKTSKVVCKAAKSDVMTVSGR